MTIVLCMCIQGETLIKYYLSIYLSTSADELIESRLSSKNGVSILSLNCQSLRAKFDYIRMLIDKFAINNCLSRLSVCKKRGFHLKPTYPYI